MFITKKYLPRRTVLRGMGATLALPLLEGMVPALTALSKTAAAPVRRLGVFYVPNGISMPYWYPDGFAEGPFDQLPPILSGLNTLKDRVLMCGGLACEAAIMLRGGDHSKASGPFLTGTAFDNSGTARAAVSMDQIAAKELGTQTQIASLELGIEDPGFAGSTCDGGVTCAYLNTIAWSTPTTPLPIENNPRAVFERLFGASGSTDPAVRRARMRKDRSILDFVRGQAAELENIVGVQDQATLSQYFDAIRDIERRLQLAEKDSQELPIVDQPVGIPSSFEDHAGLMLDLLVLGYQTDMTRVSTFMAGKEVSNRAFPEIGIADSHHPLSHHQDEPAKLERLGKLNAYHFDAFARFVKKLAATPEGDGTLLDHSMFLYGSGMSDSNTHFHDDLPIALVGGKGTGIRGGRYVRYPKQPLTNLHITILEKMGYPVETLGDSTGTIDGLTDV
ncbi:MAG TPA: DUF1552 domain-containing protein [Pseudomonadales bacterium]